MLFRSPRSFSFNSPYGACPVCHGLGSSWRFDPVKVVTDPSKPLLEGGLGPGAGSSYMQHRIKETARRLRIDISKPFDQLSKRAQKQLLEGKSPYPGILEILEDTFQEASDSYRDWLVDYMSPARCPACHGARLKPGSLAVRVKGTTIAEFTALPVARARPLLKSWTFTGREQQIAGRIVEEIGGRLEFLAAVGLDYLSLDRSAATLAGGEAQRIRLATQIGSRLRGVLYVLDEPTIGLHQRDNHRLLKALQNLRDLGNSVIVVEHDREAIAAADYMLDFGPGAGVMGGQIVASGNLEQIKAGNGSLTADYLTGKLKIHASEFRRPRDKKHLEIQGARHNNLKNIDVKIPLGVFTCVTGVSGSGKSSLINDILHKSLARKLHRANSVPGDHDFIKGMTLINKVIDIDQKPLGDTPRSNPVTYIEAFAEIRRLYAELPEARIRGFMARKFSFNVKGGQCSACDGNGYRRIEMHFLADVWIKCEACDGTRYKREVLEVKYKGKTIADVLKLTALEGLELFQNVPKVRRRFQMLCDVGLDYIELGQSATTLSGGEAQRVKLAKELARPSTWKTLYLLDEPTTGLHFADIQKLLDVLNRLVDKGNTVVVIEHNLDVIKNADYIIDLGPEGGDEGGNIVACGTPEELALVETSYTGKFIRELL